MHYIPPHHQKGLVLMVVVAAGGFHSRSLAANEYDNLQPTACSSERARGRGRGL